MDSLLMATIVLVVFTPFLKLLPALMSAYIGYWESINRRKRIDVLIKRHLETRDPKAWEELMEIKKQIDDKHGWK